MGPYRIVSTYLTQRPPHASALTPLLLWSLCLLVSLVFWENWLGLEKSLAISGDSFFGQSQYWRALTAIFAHGDLAHLLANSLFFIIFGYLLYGYFGGLLFPWLTFAAAVLTNIITVATYPPQVQLVGASGWVYVLAGTWLSLFVFIDRRLSPISRILRFLAVSLVLLMPETFKESVSYMAHGVGFGLGLLLGAIYFGLNRTWIRSHERIKFWDDDPLGQSTETPGHQNFEAAPDHP